MEEPVSCRQCGRCCFVDMAAYAEQSDFDRWHAEKRQDILDAIERHHLVWAGDRMISSETGALPKECSFLYNEGNKWLCSIYETRPKVCREYQPGSSELCAQFKNIKQHKK